jgi:hypothetical protein
MTSTPQDQQPERPARDQAEPGAPSMSPAEDFGDVWSGELTAEQISELTRRDWPCVAPDPDDPQCRDDADCWLPECPVLSPEEQARLLAEVEAEAEPQVAEILDAGFTHRDGGNGAGFAAGGVLDVMLPGAELAWHVGQVRRRGLGALTDDQLIGFLEGTHELGSWAHAMEIDAVNELDARRAGPDGSEGEHVAAEIGAALTLTPRSAQVLLERARQLQKLAPVLVLLANGIIDTRKADVLWPRLAVLSDEHAAAVLARVLPRAGVMTTGELRAACDRAVIMVDPAAALRRREKAQKDARVEVWTEDSGTGALAGRDLPPAEVIAADKNLDADARWLKDSGTQGTHEQLRAMVLLARLNGIALASLLPAAAEAAGQPAADGGPAQDVRGASHLGAGGGLGLAGSVNLTMPALAFLGLSDNPGEVAGYGPADAGTCRDLAVRLHVAGPATRWCLTLVNDSGQAVGHGCATTPPPATSPPGPGPPGTSPGTGPPGTGPPGTSPQGIAGDQVSWLAAITITPIAAGSCGHERQSAGYRPPESLRHLIKIRSPRCGQPGCRVPARQCDDDHTIPYHRGGKTCECNLHPLCRHSHRTKQAPGWHVTQPEPGILIWRTPGGRSYTKINEPYPV